MAQAAQPTGPVTHSKAWIEMVHRYLATGVGVLILTLAGATWIVRRRQRRQPAPPVDSAHHHVVLVPGGPRPRWSGSACRAPSAP